VITDLSVPAFPGERTVVTIGAYDGVHRGHQAVMAAVRERAAALGARSVVVTFDRHPASVVRPESAPKLLTGMDQKLELLAATGVDATVLVHFDEEQAAEEPLDFARRVLVGCLAAKVVVIGDDFHFGRHRGGSVATLAALGAETDFVVEPLSLLPRTDGPSEPISSTAIRRAMAGGQVELAASMLGRPFEARGIVRLGDQRGRLLGFPTANVEVAGDICLPADGVYAGWYFRPDGTRMGTAINLGRRPTFYEHAEKSLLEAHIIDFAGDVYDEPARVQFLHFLRSERKFDGLDALKSQLATDVANARRLLGC